MNERDAKIRENLHSIGEQGGSFEDAQGYLQSIGEDPAKYIKATKPQTSEKTNNPFAKDSESMRQMRQQTQNQFDNIDYFLEKFLDIRQPEDILADQAERLGKYKTEGLSRPVIFTKEVGEMAKGIGKTATAVAPFFFPEVLGAGVLAQSLGRIGPRLGALGGALEKSAALATFGGVNQYLRSLVEDKSKEEAFDEGVTTAALFGATDLAFRGVGTAGAAAYSKAKGKLANIAMPSVMAEFANRMVESTGRKYADLRKVTGTSIDELKSLFSTGLEKADSAVSNTTYQQAIKVGYNPENIAKGLDTVAKDIQTSTMALNKNLRESLPAVGSSFKKEYSYLFKTQGEVPVDITAPLFEVANALQNTSEVGGFAKGHITSLVQKLNPFIEGGDTVRKEIKAFANRYDSLYSEQLTATTVFNGQIGSVKYGGDTVRKEIKAFPNPLTKQGLALPLEAAHNLKQAVREYSKSLMTNPSTQGTGIIVGRAANALADSIDSQVGGVYSDLSTRYKTFKQVQDLSDSLLGKQMQVGSRIFSEGGTKIKTDLIRHLKAGTISNEEVINDSLGATQALFEQSKLLRENGLPKLADKIDQQYANLKEGLVQQQNLKKMGNQAILAVKGSLEKAAADREAYVRALEDSLKANKIDYREIAATQVTAYDISRASGSRALSQILYGAAAINAVKKSTPAIADWAISTALPAIESKLTKVKMNPEIRQLSLVFVNKMLNPEDEQTTNNEKPQH